MMINDLLCKFLTQFSAQKDWVILNKDIKDNGCFDFALDSGYIKQMKPLTVGCTYLPTVLCTLQGRLHMRKNKLKELVNG